MNQTWSPRIIVGIGTGRCGTLSLAKLLRRQPATEVHHECRPLLPWDCARSPHSMRTRFTALARMFPHAERIGDVGFYYLPYLEEILATFPNSRVICLRRPREETVESYAHWVVRWHGPEVDHWRADRIGLKPNPWDACFPKVPAHDIREGIRKYWEAYYERAERMTQQFPSHVRIFEMASTLNEPKKIRDLLIWVGIPPEKQVVLSVHVNRIDAAPSEKA